MIEMVQVLIKGKHAQEILGGFKGLTSEQIVQDISKSLEYAVKNDSFSVESLVERLAEGKSENPNTENKPTPKK